MTSMRYYAEERPEIDIFREKYEFLSNFFPARIIFDGLEFYNAEAAYQAAKCKNPEERLQFTELYGNQAKKLGKRITVRKDWDDVKIAVMRDILFEKFTQNPMLAKYLLETGDKPLLEGNLHKDIFWGIDSKTREGENHLGKLLMELRAKFREEGVPDPKFKCPVKQYGPVNHMTLTDEDITQMNVECIVNAANSTLLGGGGVDGAIHRVAGPELLEECRTLNGCATGEAKITKGYGLKARNIIHTVGPIYGKEDEALLAECYRNCLDLAEQYQIHSIAFPSISTGKFCYPKVKAAEIAVTTVYNWIVEHPYYVLEVVFSCPDQRNYNVMKERLQSF